MFKFWDDFYQEVKPSYPPVVFFYQNMFNMYAKMRVIEM